MSSNSPSFKGACTEAGSENAATNEANSKVVARIIGLPGSPPPRPARLSLRTESTLRRPNAKAVSLEVTPARPRLVTRK